MVLMYIQTLPHNFMARKYSYYGCSCVSRPCALSDLGLVVRELTEVIMLLVLTSKMKKVMVGESLSKNKAQKSFGKIFLN